MDESQDNITPPIPPSDFQNDQYEGYYPEAPSSRGSYASKAVPAEYQDYQKNEMIDYDQYSGSDYGGIDYDIDQNAPSPMKIDDFKKGSIQTYKDSSGNFQQALKKYIDESDESEEEEEKKQVPSDVVLLSEPRVDQVAPESSTFRSSKSLVKQELEENPKIKEFKGKLANIKQSIKDNTKCWWEKVERLEMENKENIWGAYICKKRNMIYMFLESNNVLIYEFSDSSEKVKELEIQQLLDAKLEDKGGHCCMRIINKEGEQQIVLGLSSKSSSLYPIPDMTGNCIEYIYQSKYLAIHSSSNNSILYVEWKTEVMNTNPAYFGQPFDKFHHVYLENDDIYNVIIASPTLISLNVLITQYIPYKFQKVVECQRDGGTVIEIRLFSALEYAVLIDDQNRIEKWTLKTKTCDSISDVCIDSCAGFDITPDETFAVVSDRAGFLHIFNLSPLGLYRTQKLKGPGGGFYLSPDGSVVNIAVHRSKLQHVDIKEASVDFDLEFESRVTQTLLDSECVYIGMENGQFIKLNLRSKEIEANVTQSLSPIISILKDGSSVLITHRDGTQFTLSQSEPVIQAQKPGPIFRLLPTKDNIVYILDQKIINGEEEYAIDTDHKFSAAIYIQACDSVIAATNDGDIIQYQRNPQSVIHYQLKCPNPTAIYQINDTDFGVSHGGDFSVFNIDTRVQVFHGDLSGPLLDNKTFLTENRLMYAAGITKSSIVYFSLSDRCLLCEVPMKYELVKLEIDKELLYIFTTNTLIVRKNWILTDAINISGGNKATNELKEWLNYILENESKNTQYNAAPLEAQSLIIFPYRINFLHLYAYFDMHYNFAEMQDSTARLISTNDRENPLTLSFIMSHSETAQKLVNYLLKDLGHNYNAVSAIENSLITLNNYGFYVLEQLYTKGFVINTTDKLPRFCRKGKNLPYIQEHTLKEISYQDFKEKVDFAPEGKNIEFMSSYFRIPVTPGGDDSIAFLNSLLECKSVEIFRSPFVRYLVQFKWLKVRRVLYIQASVYLAYMICLVVLLLDKENLVALILLLIINLLLISYEILQYAFTKSSYWEDSWNYIDLARAIVVFPYCVNIFLYIGDDPNEYLLVAITILSFLRGFSYFRLYRRTRYLVNMIFQILADMGAFYMILLYVTVAFAMLELSIQSQIERDNMFSYLITTYLNILGEFEVPENLIGWLVFLALTILSTVMLLNLLISVIGDTYDKVQSELSTVDIKELVKMVLEAEHYAAWKKKEVDQWLFLQVCRFEGEFFLQDDVPWEGRVRQLVSQVEEIGPEIAGNYDKINDMISREYSMQQSKAIKDIQGMINRDITRHYRKADDVKALPNLENLKKESTEILTILRHLKTQLEK